MSSMRRRVLRSSCSRVFVITGLILVFSKPASAQSLLGNSVLQLSPSAVANGMGNAFAAASIEASAIYYNPAGLTRLGGFAIEGNTFDVFQDGRYHHVASAFQAPFFRRLWLGAAYSRVGITSTIYEVDEEFNPIRELKSESREWAISLAAAAKISQHLSMGVGFKYGRSDLDFATASLGGLSNYALDLGLLYEGLLPSAHLSWRNERRPWPWQKGAHRGLSPGFSLGVTFANINLKSESTGPDLLRQIDLDPSLPPIYVNPEIDGAGTDDLLLKKLRVGLAWNFFESNEIGLVAAGELTKPLNEIAERCNGIFIGDSDENELTFAAGLEVNLLQLAAVRIGRHWGDTSSRASDSDGGFIVIPIYSHHCRSEYDIGYNSFGFSIGPPGLRFSYARISYDDNFLLRDRQIYSASIVLDKLPF